MRLKPGTRIRLLDTGEEMVALLRPNGCWPAVVVCKPDDPDLPHRLEWCRSQKGIRLDAEDIDRQVGCGWEVVGARTAKGAK